MGKLSRTKGHAWERQVATLLRDACGLTVADVRRGLQYRDGDDAPDVLHPCLSVECKCGANPPLWTALEQTEKHGSGKWRAVFLKRDHTTPVVAMPISDWLELFSSWWTLMNK